MKALTDKTRLSRLIFSALLLLAVFGTVIPTGDVLAQGRNSRSRSRVEPQRNSQFVPRGTQMKVRLEDQIDSREARDGDRFRATVLSPSNIDGATIDGHIARVQQSGKVKGQTTLTMVFDRIRFRDGGSQDVRGEVVKVYGEKSAKEVDEEGKIKSGGRGSSTAKRTAGGAAVGAIIGGIIGGGKGAAIGAGVGAAGGAGSNVIRGSNQIKLESGTEMLIRTTR